MKSLLPTAFALLVAFACAADTTNGFPFRGVVTLRRIPDGKSVSNITLVASSVTHGRALDTAAFRQILEHASPASPEIEKTWHFTDWYGGTFVQSGKTNSFILYLGGLGLLSQPDGTKGFFRFKRPEKAKP